ncbi:anosmin-1-like isoform X2 [Aethina tumida]|uniref:anosmin-1-like isoform X2 n=1 Tax=Aethina tumida TaxID=116153 RepID=UPI002147F595|nr:anosmin-1-like isoform X2 [Aethina tumida]
MHQQFGKGSAMGSSVVVLAFLLVVAAGAGARPRLRYAHHDALFVARCEARCWLEDDKSSCVKTCLAGGATKAGSCPTEVSSLSPFAAVCLDACTHDSQCPGTAKCCRHACGVTCQRPDALDTAVGLPDIPTDVRLSEGKRKKTMYISWNPGKLTYYEDTGGGTVIYLIEERHHAGRKFNEKRLTEWTPCSRTVKFGQVLKHVVKPGRWYQFRLAAVNGNGTKGYSKASRPFSISISPKPPKAPQNMTVGPLMLYKNGSLTAELRWSAPSSDLPLDRYKVFWSKRLHGAKALDSVLVHQQVVPKDQTYFILENIQPNSLYFLQVQALSQFDKERLRGDKSGLVLNTTNFTNVTDNLLVPYSSTEKRIDGLHLQKLYIFKGNLRGRVAWNGKGVSMKYTVTWWKGTCHSGRSGFGHLKFAATTKATHFELYDLQFNCRYRVGVREVSSEGMKTMHDTSVTFATPSCKNFKSHHKKIKCREF